MNCAIKYVDEKREMGYAERTEEMMIVVTLLPFSYKYGDSNAIVRKPHECETF